MRETLFHPGLAVAARTLGEMVHALDAQHDIRLVANPQDDKYFRCHYPAASPRWQLVDVHSERNDAWICPKHALSFALLPSGRVHEGMLLCQKARRASSVAPWPCRTVIASQAPAARTARAVFVVSLIKLINTSE